VLVWLKGRERGRDGEIKRQIKIKRGREGRGIDR
jgi:hypothetical protein